MFIVFNKQKIYSYLVAFSTVAILFVIAFVSINKQTDAILTSTQAREVPIYSVETNEKKIALTMNCAWNADDIDSILETLKSNKVKITFFMVGDWVDKFPEAVKKINEAGHEIRKSFQHTSTCK